MAQNFGEWEFISYCRGGTLPLALRLTRQNRLPLSCHAPHPRCIFGSPNLQALGWVSLLIHSVTATQLERSTQILSRLHQSARADPVRPEWTALRQPGIRTNCMWGPNTFVRLYTAIQPFTVSPSRPSIFARDRRMSTAVASRLSAGHDRSPRGTSDPDPETLLS